jgi:ABC-type lipoprotein export system ATPase subunit
MTMPLASVHNLERVFNSGSGQIRAIHDLDLEIFSGQLFVITGRSGAGKTTLLNLLAGLDRPTSGTICIATQDLSNLSEGELTRLRRRDIGLVFQSFALLPLLSAYENIELPLRIASWEKGKRHRRIEECLEMVGLSDRTNHRPYELSGGERQRVAIARALVHRPSLVLADEPTGELDSTTGGVVFALLKNIVKKEKVAIIVATHDVAMAEIATTARELSDGTFIT